MSTFGACPLSTFAQTLGPERTEAIVEAIFETPEMKEWARAAGEEEVAAAKFQLADWMAEHPRPATQIYSGLLLEADAGYKRRFEGLLRDYAEYFSDPNLAVNRLDDAAKLAREIAESKGLSDEAATDLARKAFEGSGGPPAELGPVVEAVDWTRGGAGAFRLDPEAFETIRKEGEKRTLDERRTLGADRRSASTLGLAARLDGAFEERQRALHHAEVSWRNFASVLSKRPEALESGLTKDELRLLSHSRNEMYRWLAAAVLARAEHRFRRLRAQLDEPKAAERVLAGLGVSPKAGRAYAARLDELKKSLDGHLKRSAEARRVLEADDYSVRLQDLRLAAAANEREALRLQGEVRRLLETPQLLRRADRTERELGLWERLVRWFYLTALPDSPRARQYRREAAARAILKRQLDPQS